MSFVIARVMYFLPHTEAYEKMETLGGGLISDKLLRSLRGPSTRPPIDFDARISVIARDNLRAFQERIADKQAIDQLSRRDRTSIINYAKRFSLDPEVVLTEAKGAPSLCGLFAQQPTRQNLYEPWVAEFLVEDGRALEFQNLPAGGPGSLIFSDGMVKHNFS